jgi:NAD(P)H-hydrate epimerase
LARQSGGSREPRQITETWAASALPRREAGAHKWGVGGLVVVAGSPGFAGAAALCCAAAGRSGAGIISAALPRSVVSIIVGLVPEVTVVILPEGDSASVAARAAAAIEERLERSAAMVIGPGLGSDDAAHELLAALFGGGRTRSGIGFGTPRGGEPEAVQGAVLRSGKPVVVDADALRWLSGQERWWERVAPEQLVLTPHPGEMGLLVDAEPAEIVANADMYASEAAGRWSQTVVLKGAPTLVASPDGALVAVDTPPALATAGSGDVLSGSIGAFLAQGLAPRDAAALAVYSGARAAMRLTERYGVLGVVAGDLPRAIAEELGALEKIGGDHE